MSNIKAIFFARFHPEKGPHVLHQVPEGAIVPIPGVSGYGQDPLFDFGAIKGLIIPSQEFCDRLLTVCVNRFRVITHPVCVEHPRYNRNQFIFNFGIVLDEDDDFTGYTTIVRKVANLFRNLEEQSLFLSREEDEKLWARVTAHDDVRSPMANSSLTERHYSGKTSDSAVGEKIYALCEMMFEDLNHYCECMIPIDDSNTINLKIFPTRSPPPPIYAWHVPLSTVQLSTISASSDLTLTRIIPLIDGTSSVSQIAQLSDTDLNLTRKAISHLVYYGCVILLDIFQYSAIYAPTAEITSFVEDAHAQDEGLRYVTVGRYRRLTEQELDGSTQETWAWKPNETALDNARLVQLYASLKQGQTLKSWCLEHNVLLAGIDVRRFITFGVIKGFLYRVHKYALLDGAAQPADGMGLGGRGASEEPAFDPERVEQWRDSRRNSAGGSSGGPELPMTRYLNGMHCFDEICTDLRLSDKKVTERLKHTYKNVTFINR